MRKIFAFIVAAFFIAVALFSLANRSTGGFREWRKSATKAKPVEVDQVACWYPGKLIIKGLRRARARRAC